MGQGSESHEGAQATPSLGTLYVVATPIGNLEDITYRAVRILRGVDRILAEDTRRTRPLLEHYGITAAVHALHDHNERGMLSRILAWLEAGESLALVSDAGTPLINDPGYLVVRSALDAKRPVVPIPGPSAPITALSAAGLATHSFVFVGFLPNKEAARRAAIELLASESRTVVAFESSHRIVASLRDWRAVVGDEREVVVARELTKAFEHFYRGPLAEVIVALQDDPNGERGEFVLLIAAANAHARLGHRVDTDTLIRALLTALSPSQAARVAREVTGERKNILYERALTLSKGADGDAG